MRTVFIHKMVLESLGRGKERRPLDSLRRLLAVALFVLAGAAFGDSSIVLSGNRLGQLGPCGCAEDPKGGLDRLVEWSTRSKRAGTRLWFDSGDNLFPLAQMNPGLADTWKQKALLIADAYRELGIGVLLPGPKDIAAGQEFLKTWYQRAGATVVAANLKNRDLTQVFWSQSVQLEEWGVTGVVAKDFGNGVDGTKGLEITDPETSLKTAISNLREKGARRIAILSGLSLAENRQLAAALKPDLIVGSSDDILDSPIKPEGTWIWQQKREAQSVAFWPADDEPREVLMTPEWKPTTKAGKKWKQKIAAGEKAATLSQRSVAVSSKPAKVSPQKKSGKFVANPYICKSCHEPQYQFWEKTHHASAYNVLYAKTQHYDPECIICHSLGFGEAAGFKSIADPLKLKGAAPRKGGEKPVLENILEETFAGESPIKPLDSRIEPDRYNTLKSKFHEAMVKRQATPGWEKVHVGIQCEHCHGNREEHVYGTRSKSKKGPVTAAVCTQCHTTERDPNFDFKTKIPKVSCPRIKQ